MRKVLFLVAISAALCSPCVQPQEPRAPAAPETVGTKGIGYPTVSAALEALRARTDVAISSQGGWTIATDSSRKTFWSFTPPGHPAHPTAVKRTVVEKDGAIFIEMGVLCQSERVACDKLMSEFQALNDTIRESTQRRIR